MLNFDTYMPVKIYSGKNAFINNNQHLIKYGNKCLIITGKKSAKISGALDDVISFLSSNNVEYQIFDKIEPNPLTSTCKKAGDIAREFGAKYIIGIGGGSVLDASKAIAIYASNQLMSHSDIYNRCIPSSHLPVILIGTTSGTGSEVTGVSVLTNSDFYVKKSISGPDCYADIAYCDYQYTMSTDINVRVSTSLDALAHAVEAFLSVNINLLVDDYALKAIKLLSQYILYSDYISIDEHDYEKLYIASIYAGLAINIAGTCFPHTVGYFLTEKYNVPHGKACALLMPVLADKAKKHCPERWKTMLDIMNCDEEIFMNAVKRLAGKVDDLSEKDIDYVSQRWTGKIKNFERTPGGFSEEEAKRALYTLIF